MINNLKHWKLFTALALAALFGFTVPADCSLLRLKSGPIDLQSRATISSSALTQTPYWIVQFEDSVTSADHKAITSVGGAVVSYIPDTALLVRVNPGSEQALQSIKRVVGMIQYAPRFKTSGDWDRNSAGSFRTLAFDDADAGEVESLLLSLGCTVVKQEDNPSTHIIQAPAGAISRILRIPQIRWVEPFVAPKLNNQAARTLMQTAGAWNIGHYGQGEIVGIADSGLDLGVGNPGLHPDFVGRVIAGFGLGRPGLTNDQNGHGTHVAGSVLGNGVQSGSNPATSSYEGSFAGVAPEAQLVFQSIEDSQGGLGGLPADLRDLFQQAYDEGARVHTNSWGAAVYGNYDQAAAQVDAFAWTNKDMVILFSAGNEGVDGNSDGVIDPDSIGSPGTAKNVITVGATESLQASGGYQFPYGTGSWATQYPVPPISTDFLSDDPQGMAAFSSRGPTNDGRIKPDIVAPGTNIISTRSRESKAKPGWGVYNADYIYLGGTSMATPLTAGAAAVARQTITETLGTPPSAALVKAAMLATASDMYPGQYGELEFLEIPLRPNGVQGWGRVNLKLLADPDPPVSMKLFDTSPGVQTGQMQTYHITILDDTVPLRIMLVWTDYPADPISAAALVNDIDLTVTTPGNVTLAGNGVIDRVNNVEGIDIYSPETGAYTITVSGYQIPFGPQPYALVVCGGLPRSYIQGQVLSSRGNPVPGVEIVAQGDLTFHTTTGSDGKYLLNVAEDDYTVTAQKAGWDFNPAPSFAVVGPAGLSGVDFTGQADPAEVKGTVYLSQTVNGSGLWESSHPYSNNSKTSVTIDGPSNAVRMRLHFSNIDTEAGYDFVNLYNAAGVPTASYSGQLGSIWSPWIDGNQVKVELVADSSIVDYGWQADGYEATIPGDPIEDVLVTDQLSGESVLSGDDGDYEIDNLEPLPSVITAQLAEHVIRPQERSISPQPDETLTGLDFVAIPEPPVVHVKVNHSYVGDLVFSVGVGEVNSPLWSQVLISRQGGGQGTLEFSIPVDDAVEYFPPSPERPWFIKVCDEAQFDTGTIVEADITRGNKTYKAFGLPTPIADQSCTVIWFPPQSQRRVGDAKKNATGLQTTLWEQEVTAVFDDRIYVQDPDRAAGMAVAGVFEVEIGDIVSASGIVQTVGCESVLTAASVVKNWSVDTPVAGLRMNNREVGGQPLGLGLPGFLDTESTHNIGLLVTVAGRVTAVGVNWFAISDGGEYPDAEGARGLRVVTAGEPAVEVGQVAMVTGISRCLVTPEGNTRAVYIRSADDYIITDGSEIVAGDDFEAGLDGWQAYESLPLLEVSQEQAHGGTYSVKSPASQQSAAVLDLNGNYGLGSSVVGWLYDDGVAAAGNQTLELLSAKDGSVIDRLAVGVNGSISENYYSVYSTKLGWVATDIARSAGWHKLEVRLYSSSIGDNVEFRIDGLTAGTARRATSFGVNQIAIGAIEGQPGFDGYFDEISFGFAE